MSEHKSHPAIDPARAAAFFTSGRLAVVGASDDPKNFGRTIFTALAEHGINAVAVHPTATTVAGTTCYPTIAAVPGQLDGVIVMVPQDSSADVVRECVERKVLRVWLFQGLGRGAVSAASVQLCQENGIEIIAGACPLMFLEPVTGVHKLHRSIRRARGSVAKTAA